MFDQCMYFNTQALARSLEREWTQAFEPFGLTPAQAFMLRAVLRQPGSLQHELAEGMVLSKPTVTRMLDSLQSKELIERRESGQDAREWAIYPTAAALALRQGIESASGQVTKRLKQTLSEETFADVVGKVRKVRSAIE
jgi:MarR family transcriptional regulator, temperature-dependent positive regulator of motility